MAAREVTAEAGGVARLLEERLGVPDLGVVLGSGFGPLAESLGAGDPLTPEQVPGLPRGRADGHGGGVSAARRPAGNVWVFRGRLHLYEGLAVEQVVFPVAVLAAAGARAILLTCATGGLDENDRAGDLAVVTDHLNLTGCDPTTCLQGDGAPAHVDLQEAYDPRFRDAWMRQTAGGEQVRVRHAVLACVHGPCYETPAEVRMLRVLGADLVCMSTVPEVIAARSLGLAVAAVACVANRGAGMEAAGPIRHTDVLETVRRTTRRAGPWLVAGVDAMLELTRRDA
jgi:purine-nucleoside phosphorylase